jgi:hypothetical protein
MHNALASIHSTGEKNEKSNVAELLQGPGKSQNKTNECICVPAFEKKFFCGTEA